MRATYLGTEVEVLRGYTPKDGAPEIKHLAKGKDFCATPADSDTVWCQWPDGKMWKHFRSQLTLKIEDI